MRSNKFFVPALMFFSFSAVADVPLSQADLLGTWQIDKESLQRDGSKSRSLNSTWTFNNDGTMDGVSEDSDVHARAETIRASLNYSVEDGKLVKQAAPGRSKMETCTAVEKENNKMVLKCQDIYFFMTKK
ncbi:MAG: lipocalin family protein [Gammaproteobacteria bacterium]